jgi:hypothetical protein
MAFFTRDLVALLSTSVSVVSVPNLECLLSLVPRIVDVMRSHPEVLNSFGELGPVPWLRNYPSGSCDITSLTIASVFFDLGLGDWELVSSFDEGGQGHTWLRLITDGSVSMSVDATLHQFNDWNEPWIGVDNSPAASKFNNVNRVYRFSDVPAWWPRRHEAEVAAWVREKFVGTLKAP